MIKLIAFFFCLNSFALEDFSGKDSMNGISYKDYEGFTEKWSLVTIRFRKDTGEMRLTYANEIAMKTLKAGKTDYPDGAVFAKTGIHTASDPQFVSSVVPKGIRRYQLMVKNKKLYSTTNGWGYGLYDSKGKTFPEDPKITQDACYACHTIVENRGDVFSEPFDFIKDTKFANHHSINVNAQIKYKWISTQKLPKTVFPYVPAIFPKIRMVTNDILRKHLFQGTLDEMKPILEDESRKEKTPAIFMSADNKKFVIVIPKKSEECMEMGSFEIVSTSLTDKPIVEKYCTHD
jgi:hypothetical protein